MILTVSLNSSVDHALFINELKLSDTNRVTRTERDAGGKGINVARVAAELGADVIATGFLAGGPGGYVEKVLDAQGVNHDFVEVPGETRINFSFEDSSGMPPTTFNEPGPFITPEAFADLREHCARLAKNATWVCLGGSLPPGAPGDAFKLLLEDCRREGCSFVLDADGEPMLRGLEANPTFVKPNSREAGRLVGRGLDGLEDCIACAEEILARLVPRAGCQPPIVVISRGAEGAILASLDCILVGKSPKVSVKSTIGSGDSLIGGMLWAFEKGMPVEEAFRWGLAAGAATATTDGSEIARKAVVLDLLPRVSVEPWR